MADIGSQVAKLSQSFDNGTARYFPFITSIWFPHYKSLEPDLRIDFKWPITVIVGPNGTNKTSILHALAGAPEGKSIAEFWYSTSMDDIDKWGGDSGSATQRDNDPHRFVYSYRFKQGFPEAECRKARVTRPFRAKGLPSRVAGKPDPDYWEPTKITVSDGMSPIPDSVPRKYRHKDRWKLLEKPVVFMDLKAEISAYNKFVDHGITTKNLDNATKVRVNVQKRSDELRRAFDRVTTDKSILRRIISSSRELEPEVTKEISDVLGKEIEVIRVMKHKFFGASGTTFKLRLKGVGAEYTEAHAGSGEFSIIRLIDEIQSAKPGSLILLDEPEISLHPGAQSRFMNYLLRQTLDKKHQVVISTHSPSLIEHLPSQAIKVLGFNNASKKVHLFAQESSPIEAFNVLGQNLSDSDKFRFYVEDELAKEIVESSIRRRKPALAGAVDVRIVPGGADSLLSRVLPVLAQQDGPKTGKAGVLLDGDQKSPKFDDFVNSPLSKSLASLLSGDFDTFWISQVHKTIPYKFVHSDKSNKAEMEKQLLEWAHCRLGFITYDQPEKLILRYFEPDEFETLEPKGYGASRSPEFYKNWWVGYTRRAKHYPDHLEISSKDILAVQTAALDQLPDDSPLFDGVFGEISRLFPDIQTGVPK